MKIRVKLFATLRAQAGWAEREIDAPEGITIGGLLGWLEEEYGNLSLTGRPVYAAVNQEYSRVERVVQAGDLVALFPPVSGGALAKRGAG